MKVEGYELVSGNEKGVPVGFVVLLAQANSEFFRWPEYCCFLAAHCRSGYSAVMALCDRFQNHGKPRTAASRIDFFWVRMALTIALV